MGSVRTVRRGIGSEYDILRILNAETPVDEEVTKLDFGDNLSVEQTGEDGVRIDAAASGGDSSLAEWSETDTGVLSGPSLNAGEINSTLELIGPDDDIATINSLLSEQGTILLFETGRHDLADERVRYAHEHGR